MSSRSEYLATLPRERVTDGVLVRDDAERVLLVEPTKKDTWLIPDGMVESHESPRQGAAREALEELCISHAF